MTRYLREVELSPKVPYSTAIPRMLAPQFAQNFLQLFFENHTQIQCFDVKITINK